MTAHIKDCRCMANEYLVGHSGARKNFVSTGSGNYFNFFGGDEEDIMDLHAPRDMDIAGDVLRHRVLNQAVPVTVILLDRFGPMRTHFTVSRRAHWDGRYWRNLDLLYNEINDWLNFHDTMMWDVSGIRVEASDDEAGRPYAAHLIFNRGALPAGILDQPRHVDLGIVLNRQMNILDFISGQLQDLLFDEMLNLNLGDAEQYIPAREWTITIAARDMQFPHHWRSQH